MREREGKEEGCEGEKKGKKRTLEDDSCKVLKFTFLFCYF